MNSFLAHTLHLLFPQQAYAAGGGLLGAKNLNDAVTLIIDFIRIGVLPILLSIFFIFFLVRILTFIRNLEQSGGSVYENAYGNLLAPILLLFTTVSVWSILEVVRRVLLGQG